MLTFLLSTIVRPFFPIPPELHPRFQSRERVRGGGYESLRKCHEILVGPPSQSRRILHALFVALSRIINRKIEPIFSSLRFVEATAIAESSRSLISWKTRLKVVRLSARRIKRSELLYFPTIRLGNVLRNRRSVLESCNFIEFVREFLFGNVSLICLVFSEIIILRISK